MSVIKPWCQATTAAEQQELVAEALDGAGTVTGAAKLLGMSRRHLTRYLSENKRLSEKWGLRVPSRLYETGETSSLTNTVDVNTDGETLTLEKSLTYTRAARTLRHVALAAPTAPMEEETVRVVLEIPKSLVDWMELEALRRKQRGERHRMAKAPIAIEAIEQYRRRVERGEDTEE